MTNHHHKLNTIETAPECGNDDFEDTIDLLPASIFDADFIGQEVPGHFNAVRIPIDGTMQADLSWNEAKAAAEKYCLQGLRIFWEIDLGLFARLKRPLGDQSQFLALCLSLEHFRDTLWKQFRDQTVGICLYRGNADYCDGYQWDEEQLATMQAWVKDAFGQPALLAEEVCIAISSFDAITVDMLTSTPQGQSLLRLFCRDAAAEYLDLLARRLPDTLMCVAMLDSSPIADPLQLAQLTVNERYPGMCVAVKSGRDNSWQFACDSSSNDMATIGKQSFTAQQNEQPLIGICLPLIACRKPSDYQGLKEVLAELSIQKKAYRVVAESRLTTEWDGLDYLIVAPQSLSLQGYRKLRGFCAAGGMVVSLGEPLGLTQEMSIEEFLPYARTKMNKFNDTNN